MNLRGGLLLVTHQPDTVAAVAGALGQNGRFEEDCVCRDLTQMLGRMQATPAQAVLVDIDPRPARILTDLEPIVARFSETRFVVLSTDQRSELILAAMQVGARHFMAKSAIQAELSTVLHRLVRNGTAQARKYGELITVLSGGGGCGATTVAINLANELRLLQSSEALIVDLDGCYGAVASYLGLDGTYGLSDILSDPRRLDAQLIRSTALTYGEGLQVLLSSARTAWASGSTDGYQHLLAALDICRSVYRCVVIDAPRVPSELAAAVMSISQVGMIVFQLTVKDIRFVQSLLSVLGQRGVCTDPIVLLANRYRKRRALVTIQEAETALGRTVVPLANDFPSALKSMNYGQPLAQAAPRSCLRREFQALAARLSKAHANGQAVPSAR